MTPSDSPGQKRDR